MGMGGDNNEVVSLEEQRERERHEKELAAKRGNIKTYTELCVFKFKKGMYQILVGPDKKWYKSKITGKYRIDPHNKTPEIWDYEDEITPLEKEEWEEWQGIKSA